MLDPIERPIFLVGADRSGTTLLRLMLSHHPNLAFHFESGFLVKPLVREREEPKGAALRAYQDWLRSSEAFLTSGFVIDESLPYRELLRSFLRQKLLLTGKTNVGATVHKGFEHLPRIWPHARYIHLVRDGRDVAFSMVRLGWYGNAWAATERWKEALQSYDKLARFVSQDQLLDVKFERLIDNPQRELSRISSFVGIPYTPSYFEYAYTSSYSMPAPEKAVTWKDSSDEKMVRLIEAELGSLLTKSGYELSGLDPIELTDQIRRRLRRDNESSRRWSAIRRFGFWTICVHKLANKSQNDFLRRLTTKRLSRIRRNHLQ